MNTTLDLNGKWALRWHDGDRGPREVKALEDPADQRRAIPATVPGAVHLDLMRAGLIKDPHDRLNVLECRWVEERFWYYRRTFQAPTLRKGQKAFLVFEGLDLAAEIHLNGKQVGTHANSFYPCRLDVTATLAKGENALVVKLDSGLFHAANRSNEGFNVNTSGQLTKRPWLRKPQHSSGWDHAPRMLNVGIHGAVRLEIVESFRFDQASVLTEVSEDYATGTVTARMHVEGLEEKPVKAVLRVEVVEARVKTETPVVIRKGSSCVEAKVTLPKPRLWWPVGHGAANRYTVKVTLVPERGAKVEAVRKIGFRRVRVNQDPHPEAGRYFTIEVNGRKIFCKGGNLVPADLIPARLDRARYRTLVDRTIESNGNFIRVWGGGLYAADEFYDECDRRGVLVWQEFIFACGKYPANDNAFLTDIKQEAAYQVRRLAHRPSLIVWCGNNEMEQAAWEWGYEGGVAYPDHGWFHDVLPRIVREHDGTRYYQPSSPMSPDLQSPTRHDMGDQHPWDLGFVDMDFRKYRKMICRFPNEGGILGPTSLPTVLRCLPPDQRKMGSLAWDTHDNAIGMWQGYRIFQDWLGMDPEKLSIEEYVYWGGVLQGEGLSEYIRNFHRRMFDSSSAVFWALNDVWPMVRGWATVDYNLNRTPPFHPVRRAFASINVVVVAEDNAKDVVVYGINETCAAVTASLRFGVFTLAGQYPVDRRQEVVLPPNASTPVATFPRRLWTRPTASTAFAVLTAGGEVVARDRLLLPLFKEMRWPQANVRITCRDGQATFTSKTFAWRVCLDLNGDRKLADNFFDVFPGQPYTIPWSGRTPPHILFVGNQMRE
jgi:beta-mannosidase